MLRMIGNLRTRSLLVTSLVSLALLLSVMTYAVLYTDATTRLSLMRCGLYSKTTEKSECVFLLIKRDMVEKGVPSALDMFTTASAMFPHTLDIDCHSGIHRVGDMAYYDLYLADPDISKFEFPEKSMICNRGFFHGIFEHMIQDRTDPTFISSTCNSFKSEDPLINAVVATCFHAAGHGLFRNQAESVPQKDWGNLRAFLDEPVAVCASLPDATDRDRHACTTGVESIFIQTSILNEYGFKDPNLRNALAVCDQMPSALHDSCYEVRSLMVSQIHDDYLGILDDCIRAPRTLFNACIRGTIVGLFVNGVSEHSFSRTLEFCASPRVASKDGTSECYRRLGFQLQVEYRGDFRVDCGRFPSNMREYCTIDDESRSL